MLLTLSSVFTGSELNYISTKQGLININVYSRLRVRLREWGQQFISGLRVESGQVCCFETESSRVANSQAFETESRE